MNQRVGNLNNDGLGPEGTVYEGLQITLHPAPFLKRLFAYALDLAIVGSVIYAALVVIFVFGAASIPVLKGMVAILKTPKAIAAIGFTALIVVLVAVLCAYHAYFILFETKRGYTPGKKVFGLQVSSVDGSRLSAGQCVLRDMFRYIDCMLVVPGLISVLLTKKSQRLGDLAANTIVTHSAHKEQAANFLYVKQDDYLLLKENWAPLPVPVHVCEEYLKFAYPTFFQGKRLTGDGQVEYWQNMALQYVRPQGQEPMDSTSLLLFFAELCFQTTQGSKQRSSL